LRVWKNSCSDENLPPRGEIILRQRIKESARLFLLTKYIGIIKLREVNKGTIYGAGKKFEIRKKNFVQKSWNEEAVFRN